jgi:hypothetical protein
MSMDEDNLLEYIENSWDASVATAPNEYTRDESRLFLENCLHVRRIGVDSYWVSAGLKKKVEKWEIFLSHPEHAAADHLLDILGDYPGTQPAVLSDSFENLDDWTVTNNVTAANDITAHSGTYSAKFVNASGASPQLVSTGTPPAQPTTVSWEFYIPTTAVATIQPFLALRLSTTNVIFVIFGKNGQYRTLLVNGTIEYGTSGYIWSYDAWHNITLFDIDWTAHTFSLKLDGTTRGTGVSFASAQDSIDNVRITNNGNSNAFTYYVDDFDAETELGINLDALSHQPDIMAVDLGQSAQSFYNTTIHMNNITYET